MKVRWDVGDTVRVGTAVIKQDARRVPFVLLRTDGGGGQRRICRLFGRYTWAPVGWRTTPTLIPSNVS